MRNRFLLFGVLFTLASTFSYSQSLDGKLKGNVTDKKTGEAIVGAQVTLKMSGTRKGASATDVDGNYTISPIDPGTYDLDIFFLGYDKKTITGLQITSGRTLTLDVQLTIPEAGNSGLVVNIQQWRDPGLTVDNTITGKSLTGDELDKMPSKDINTALTLTGGVQTDNNGNIAIKGDRPGQSKYIIDGIPYGTGEGNLPFLDIESLDIITGGIPAEYGDLTGGAIIATTKGPSSELHGRVEGLTSELLDKQGYNLLQGFLSGPLLRSKDHTKTILGFSISGEYNYDQHYYYPATDVYSVQPSVLNSINANPILPSPSGQGYYPAAEYVTMAQMQHSQAVSNIPLSRYSFTGKLDFQPVDNIDITVGATTDHTDHNAFIYDFSMFNSANNPEVIQDNYTAFARFRQTFKSGPEDMIQDAYYTVEFSYVNNSEIVQDPTLKGNVFEYGYLGKFNVTNTPIYQYKTDTVNGKLVSANYLLGYAQTAVTYTPGGYNTAAENYDKQFFALNNGVVGNEQLIQGSGGLLNGQSPGLIYGLWDAPGTYYSSYSKSSNEQYDLTASGTATLAKKHTLKFGIEYQQKVDRSYAVGGNFQQGIQGLWSLGRQLLNTQLTQLDKTNPIIVNSNGNFTDTINYPYQIAPGAQTAFDANFRNYLISTGARDANGNLINQQTLINIDQYTPADLKLSYFTPDELLQNGHSLVSAYGYDYEGNILRGKPSVDDFLDPTKRAQGAYNPIYTAGFIQDKFELNSITFNIGLRVDRFDANQVVLKDPFSLEPVRQVAQVQAQGINGAPVSIPGNISQSAYVYVDDVNNPTKITGFRSGSTWYDANGTEETDPGQIARLTRTGTITPYFVDPTKLQITDASFTNYVPQVNLMPRISFSFPISENASFYANYDVLTITPTGGNAFALDNYYYINTRSVLGTIPNPNLQPEQRTNYEIGFKQKISANAAVSVNAYFGQIKNEIELYRYIYAYPIDYNTYNNIDFGTVKGITLGFDTKRPYEHPFSGMTISANYTLQFADGTGSDANSAGNLIAAGEPELRSVFPLAYDTRNQINGILDYRFGHDFDYSGPRNSSGKGWLENAGVNLLLTAKSGNPYSAAANVTDQAEIGLANRNTLSGTIDGSRYPWQFTANLKIDKSFNISSGKTNDKKKSYFVNVYLQFNNLLNTLNVVYVYPYTGLPNQDGYLQSQNGISEARNAASQQAFIDQFNVKLNNPGNYVSPRTIRLGAYLQF